MEVKINREIRDYAESMFFGLSLRQFFFSAAALGVAVVIYLMLKPVLGMETVSWVCIIGAVPFAAMGFVRYHGMSAEQFIMVWLRSELIEPAELKYSSKTIYQELLEMEKDRTEKVRKGKKKNGNENDEAPAEAGQGTV